MPYWRDYVIAPGCKIGALYIAPVVETSLRLSGFTVLCTCVAAARPLGFAVLTAQGGFWLPGFVTVHGQNGISELVSVQELEAAIQICHT